VLELHDNDAMLVYCLPQCLERRFVEIVQVHSGNCGSDLSNVSLSIVQVSLTGGRFRAHLPSFQARGQRELSPSPG
jgi:hypothetical protein